MNAEKLFWTIFRAQNEDALHEIIKNDALLNDNKNWFPYGGRDEQDRSNFGIFENHRL